MASEPDASGAGNFNGTIKSKGSFGRSRTSNVSAQFNFDIPGLGDVQKQLSGVSNALKEMKATLAGMSSSFTSGPLVNMLNDIKKASTETAASLRDLSGATSAMGGSGKVAKGVIPVSNGNSTSPNAGMATQSSQSVHNAVQQVSGFGTSSTGGGATAAGGKALGSAIGGLSGSSFASSIPIVGGIIQAGADLAMMPLRFARERIQNNRTQALGMSQELTPYQWQMGGNATPDAMMRNLSIKMPGQTGSNPGIQGDVSDILNALTIGRQSGAQYGFGARGSKGTGRANGFYEGIAQMQQITPGLGAGAAASILGNQTSNVASHQADMMMTGGAFGMIKVGGGQKNIREWSEGILKFLQNQRPGSSRGKRFTYGELLAQNFPGSNINAWFQTVGVSADMTDYFWSYALAQAGSGMGEGGDIFKDMAAKSGTNQATQRLSSQHQLAVNEFGLAGQMGGQYATREKSNQWFNKTMGNLVNSRLPGLTKGLLGGVAGLPDQVEDFLWNALESSGPLVQGVTGAFTWGALAAGDSTAGYSGRVEGPIGDVGDIGDVYDGQGARSTAGLNPDLRNKMSQMMKANPNLRINSGLRDTSTQNRLKAKGIGKFGARNNKSPHFAGEAADLGPRSQYGWLQANAHKFGLQTANAHGEPWHVQRAGTIGAPRRGGGRGMGDIGEPPAGDGSGETGGLLDWLETKARGLPVVGGLIGGALDFSEDISGLVKLLKTVFGSVLSGIESSANAASALDFQGLLSGKHGSKSGIEGTSNTLLSMLTGGVPGGSGNNRTGLGPGIFVDGKSVFDGLGGTLSGLGSNIWSGVQAITGLGGASLSDIYTKYAEGPPAKSKTADAATQAKILSTLSVAQQAGFRGEELVTFVSLAGRESSFNPRAYNGNLGTHDQSYGLWQINTLDGAWDAMKGPLGLSSKEQLFDPLNNARAGKWLFDQSKTPFNGWGPYKGQPPLFGGAEQWVAPVYAVAKEAGLIGDPGFGYDDMSGRTQHITFHNTFKIDGSGGGSGGPGTGLDIGRLVPKLGDKLEEDLRRRMVSLR